MIKNNKGNVMLWVIVLLFVISLIVVVYARIVNLDYKISLSSYRQQAAFQNSTAGLAIAKEYFKNNSNEITTFNHENAGTTLELYPNNAGVFEGFTAERIELLEKYEIQTITLSKNQENKIFINVEATFKVAKSKISVEIIDVNNIIYGYLQNIS